MGIVIKGIPTMVVAWLGWTDKTFSPLIWVLVGLAVVDVLMNVGARPHSPDALDVQFKKIGAAVLSLGAPAILASAYHSGDLARIFVAVLIIAYIQVIYPQVATWFKSDPALVQEIQDDLHTVEAKAIVDETPTD